MKKVFILSCIVTLLFAGTVYSEPVEFPNGVTIDVAPGWSYEAEGDGILLFSEDETCSVAIIISKTEGTAEEIALAMSDEHNGTEPEKIDDNTYIYAFENENGVNTDVFVGVEDGKLRVLSITGDHEDVEDMINSITEK